LVAAIGRARFIGASYKSERSHEFWLNRIVLADARLPKEPIVLADSVPALGQLMWSPDSTMLAHISRGTNEACALTIYDVLSATQSFTTNGKSYPKFGFGDTGYDAGAPLWTPDSGRLVLGTPHEVWVWERAPRELRHVATFTNTELVAHIGSFYRSTAWLSPDGHSVGFSAIDPHTKDAQIYVVDLESGKAEKTFQRPVFLGTPGVNSIPETVDLSDNGQTVYAVIQASDEAPQFSASIGA
jgi:hypothetical protein